MRCLTIAVVVARCYRFQGKTWAAIRDEQDVAARRNQKYDPTVTTIPKSLAAVREERGLGAVEDSVRDKLSARIKPGPFAFRDGEKQSGDIRVLRAGLVVEGRRRVCGDLVAGGSLLECSS